METGQRQASGVWGYMEKLMGKNFLKCCFVSDIILIIQEKQVKSFIKASLGHSIFSCSQGHSAHITNTVANFVLDSTGKK